MKPNAYDSRIAATQVAVLRESFTPEFEVLSVHFAFPEETVDQQVLSIQRAFGADAENEGICLVLSPSQQCAYDPFQEAVLARSFLDLEFTSEAAAVFGVRSVCIDFSIEESLFREIKEELSIVFQGKSVLRHEPTA